MKRVIIILTFLISVITNSNLFAQQTTSLTGEEYQRDGNTFSIAKNSSSSAELTNYTWKDSKGNEYPIYISTNGSCYILKVSNKTDKEYKQYMKVEISKQICKELNRKYKDKNK